MFEKVNPSHPDKVADRIAGAIVDYCYTQQENPKCAIEVLIGHGLCTIIAETSVELTADIVAPIVDRIAGTGIKIILNSVPQDVHLAENQAHEVRCGDNGIFKGVPTSYEEMTLSSIARGIYGLYPSDGKYILDGNKLIICQSNATRDDLAKSFVNATINPLGDWTGGTDVDSGATNRKLGSDMGRAVTGGGLHGKDISKADVSVNIYAYLKAQETGQEVSLCCAIGDDMVDGKPYSEIVKIAKDYIDRCGGFEQFACWGLV